jgi:radical SAM superfamily enzyme YgiQ (UPF0313 family)
LVVLGKWKNQSLSLSLKPNSLTISLQTSRESQVYSFDGEGRLWTAMLAGVSYRRGLNGRMVAKWQTGISGTERDRRWLSDAERKQLEEHSRQIIIALMESLQASEVTLNAPLPTEALPFFRRAADFTQERYQQDVANYHQVYKPIGILPPDQYMAVVLQATEGCSFNTCTFCDFYRDRRFRIKAVDEFKLHAQTVKDYLGQGLALRRTIFLGDANALVIPMPRLRQLIAAVHEIYDVEKLGGIFAFLDGFSGERKTVEDYRLLAQQGLKRIYIGMESGSADLLHLLKKPGRPEDVIQAVKTIKSAGIAVGIIVLLGAGGQVYSQQHIDATVAAINSMPLDLDDLIYFSELVESEGMEYTRDAYQHQLKPLSSAERIAQGEAIERQLVFSEEGGIPHISRYDIREFVY